MNHRIRRHGDDPVRGPVLAAVAALVLVSVLGTGLPGRASQPERRTSFASQIAALSEPDGYFDTDNLVSNERLYLSVLPELVRRNVRGGAYIGVGPDQNFSYIAAIRPSIAFIVDIRRDNLLLHLLFKAIFQQAGSRVEYLALLFGRPLPPDSAAWREASAIRLAETIGRPALDSAALAARRVGLEGALKKIGVPLSVDDFATIERFHQRFIDSGLALRFQSTGRPPQSHYPTYEELLLETDGTGHQRNYLAAEESFQFVKALEARDDVIPVVGNLSGSSALLGIARVLRDRGDSVSAFYLSNVEFYLDRDGSYPRFLANLSRFPRTDRSVVIRSIFGRGGSYSEVQGIGDLVSQSAVVR